MSELGPRSQRSVIRALIIGLGTIVALVLLLTLGLLAAMRYTSQREMTIRNGYYPRLILSERVRAAVLEQETALRGYVATGDGRILEQFNTARDTYLAARDDLLARAPLAMTTGELRDRQFSLAEQWYSEVALPQTQLRQSGATTPDEQAAAIEQGQGTLDGFRAANQEYTTAVQVSINDATDDIRRTRRLIYGGALTGGLIVVGITILISRWLVRIIRTPLERLDGVVAAIERGDAGARVPALGAVELDRLGQGINGMLDSLATTARATEIEHRRLGTIVESASEGIIVVDGAGLVTTFNPAAERMFEVEAGEIVGQPVETLEFLTREEMSVTSLPVGQTSFTAQPIVRRRGERMLSALVSPLVGSQPGDGGVVWVVRDVTELARVDEMKSEFISIVSHELRTPLTAIKGFTDLILEGDVGEVTEEQREFLEIVQSNSDRLVALINDMLDISRIEAGRITLNLDQVDLAHAIDNVVTSFRPTLEAKRMSLQTELADDARQVMADEARLGQILQNLISNACKYTPAGGWVTVRAVRVGRQVAASVSDTGIGMPADALPRVFSKFYRVDQAGASGISGTGLGLAITKSLVELHGGRITIASKPNTGTTVRFTLPAYGATEEKGEHQAVGPDGAQPSAGRILLAEDDADAAAWMQRVLTARGFDVTLVPDGLAALVRAIELLPDVIVLDVDMPKMGASEVIPQLKNNPGTRDIPVVVITGTVPDSRAYFIEAGAADFFSKPIDDEVVAARLTHLVKRG